MKDYEADAVTARALVNHRGVSIKVDEKGNHVITITDPSLNEALAAYIKEFLLSYALGGCFVR